MKALIVIDFTNDFIDGSLPVGQPGIDIASRVNQLTEQFVKSGDFVVMAVDLHEANDSYHPESNRFHRIIRAAAGGVSCMGNCITYMKRTRKTSIGWTKPVTAPLAARIWS